MVPILVFARNKEENFKVVIVEFLCYRTNIHLGGDSSSNEKKSGRSYVAMPEGFLVSITLDILCRYLLYTACHVVYCVVLCFRQLIVGYRGN